MALQARCLTRYCVLVCSETSAAHAQRRALAEPLSPHSRVHSVQLCEVPLHVHDDLYLGTSHGKGGRFRHHNKLSNHRQCSGRPQWSRAHRAMHGSKKMRHRMHYRSFDYSFSLSSKAHLLWATLWMMHYATA